jgi:hypothetical protein
MAAALPFRFTSEMTSLQPAIFPEAGMTALDVEKYEFQIGCHKIY